MADPFGRLRGFLRELKRRNLYRAAAGYLVVTFMLVRAEAALPVVGFHHSVS